MTKTAIGALAAAAVAVSLTACSTTVTPQHAASSSKPPAPAAPVVVETSDPAPVYLTPRKSDFTVKLKTLSKECFGSAGCVISYRPQLVENFEDGATDPAVTYDVSFTVTGGQDGPVSDTIYATGDQYEQPMDGTAQTATSAAKLTAKVTAVEAE